MMNSNPESDGYGGVASSTGTDQHASKIRGADGSPCASWPGRKRKRKGEAKRQNTPHETTSDRMRRFMLKIHG